MRSLRIALCLFAIALVSGPTVAQTLVPVSPAFLLGRQIGRSLSGPAWIGISRDAGSVLPSGYGSSCLRVQDSDRVLIPIDRCANHRSRSGKAYVVPQLFPIAANE
jgi:hypothetical protein